MPGPWLVGVMACLVVLWVGQPSLKVHDSLKNGVYDLELLAIKLTTFVSFFYSLFYTALLSEVEVRRAFWFSHSFNARPGEPGSAQPSTATSRPLAAMAIASPGRTRRTRMGARRPNRPAYRAAACI